MLLMLPLGVDAQRATTADTARSAAGVRSSTPSSLDRLRLIFRAPRRGTTRVMGASRGTAPGALPAAFALVPPQQRGHFVAQFTRPLRALPVCVTQDSVRVVIEVRLDTVLVVVTTLSRGIHLVAIAPAGRGVDMGVVLWRVRAGRGDWQSQIVAERAAGVRSARRGAGAPAAGPLGEMLLAGRWYDAIQLAATSAAGHSHGSGEWLDDVNALAAPACPHPTLPDAGKP